MKKIAIIPARGGSKRIPRKNIRPFFGKPVIEYSINTARGCGLFEEIMVSTDDEEIATIARDAGASVPFYRSEQTSNDHAGIVDVIKEVLLRYKQSGNEFDCFCCILPTAPLLRPERLNEAFEIMMNGNYDSVFPVVQFSYPIQRALTVENLRARMLWPENYAKRSQDLQPAYHDAGQFYWMWTDRFFSQNKVFAENSGAVVLSEREVQDIDTEEDWILAEMKYRLIKGD